jgi:hypothetical protein
MNADPNLYITQQAISRCRKDQQRSAQPKLAA